METLLEIERKVEVCSLSPRGKSHTDEFPPLDMDSAIARCEACISPLSLALQQLTKLKETAGTPSVEMDEKLSKRFQQQSHDTAEHMQNAEAEALTPDAAVSRLILRLQ